MKRDLNREQKVREKGRQQGEPKAHFKLYEMTEEEQWTRKIKKNQSSKDIV